MLPNLRALFNEPRRLRAGKGTQIRGYADKKTISGVQSNGAPSIFTLWRSESSAPVPDQGTGENPIELRGGQNVRLHGYGGIHTLERLLVPVPDEAPLGIARLEWEFELLRGDASICSAGGSSNTPFNYVVAGSATNVWTNGSWVDTFTHSGVISAYGPDDPPPAECAEPVSESTYDPGFDYGDEVSVDITETLVPYSDLAAPAIGAVGVLSEGSDAAEWTPEYWRDVSYEVIFFSAVLGAVGVTLGVLGAVATGVRFRLCNRGSAALRVDCGFYGVGLSDVTATLDLAPGAVSAWQEAPSIDTDPAKYYTAEIRRVRIGRFRTIP